MYRQYFCVYGIIVCTECWPYHFKSLERYPIKDVTNERGQMGVKSAQFDRRRLLLIIDALLPAEVLISVLS